jgi:hypothetical protein
MSRSEEVLRDACTGCNVSVDIEIGSCNCLLVVGGLCCICRVDRSTKSLHIGYLGGSLINTKFLIYLVYQRG